MTQQIVQAIITSVAIAIIFGLFKVFRDVEQLKVTVQPVVTWYVKTSMDALKIATNPTSERLTELADKYIASVNGTGRITTQEKQELIDGLREVMNDKKQLEAKRQSASMSLRFIETREGLTSKAANSNTNH